jgi:hypothetical protein
MPSSRLRTLDFHLRNPTLGGMPSIRATNCRLCCADTCLDHDKSPAGGRMSGSCTQGVPSAKI